MEKIIVIVGPTAVGKTALSIELAQRFNGEIINGDSMQIYRDLVIGTAKVTEEEQQGVVHHLFAQREWNESYSVAEFQKEARQVIQEVLQRGKVPIIVGGTGLYVQALVYDYQLGKGAVDVDLALREKYEAYAKENGKEALWRLLEQKDPLAAKAIHLNNQRKVIRALEVFELTGKSILTPEKTPEPLYDAFFVGLNTDREQLYERINQRVKIMMTQGLEEEAKRFIGYEEVQAAKGIGYKEFFPYFSGQLTKEEVIENIQQNSRRYAKRQLTWFRNRLAVHWYDLITFPESKMQLETDIKRWMEGQDD